MKLPQHSSIGNRRFSDLQSAANALQPGDILELGEGVYSTPLIIRQPHVAVIGKGHVVFDGKTAEDKGTIIAKGNDFLLKNIECKGVKVANYNGSCLRFEGRNLTVEHVYFHHSEQGILTGDEPGTVTIKDSRFEQLGRNGRAHGIYIGGGELHIEDSLFIAAVDEGHEIKSRAKVTEIINTVIASLTSHDSRLIDISNGGWVSIRDSILEKGPGSVNGDVIGYGLEGMHSDHNYIEVKNNLVILERSGLSNLIHTGSGQIARNVSTNIIISKDEPHYNDVNTWFKNRREAGLQKYPYLPTKTMGLGMMDTE